MKKNHGSRDKLTADYLAKQDESDIGGGDDDEPSQTRLDDRSGYDMDSKEGDDYEDEDDAGMDIDDEQYFQIYQQNTDAYEALRVQKLRNVQAKVITLRSESGLD